MENSVNISRIKYRMMREVLKRMILEHIKIKLYRYHITRFLK